MKKLVVEFSILFFLLDFLYYVCKFKSLLKAIFESRLKVETRDEATYIPESSLSVKGCGTGGISLLSFKVMSESKY